MALGNLRKDIEKDTESRLIEKLRKKARSDERNMGFPIDL
jgi:hypothetical protein